MASRKGVLNELVETGLITVATAQSLDQDASEALYGGPTAAAIADPTGGATVDAEARTAINAIIAALENAGIVAP